MRRFFLGLTFSLAAGALPAVAAADNVEFSQSIATALRDSGRLVDYSIGVVSEDGVVQLDGRVANKEQQAQAIEMTKAMPGVSKVVNNLQVKATPKTKGKPSGVRTTSMDEASAPELNGPGADASGNGDLVSKLRAGRTSSAASVAAKKAAGQQGSQRQYSQQQQMAMQQQAMAQQMAMQQSMQGMPPQGMQKGMPRPLPPGQAQQAMMAGRPVQQMAMNPANCPPGMGGGAMGMGAGAAGMAMGAAGAAMGMGGGGMGGPMPMGAPSSPGGVRPAGYDQPYMPNHAWPSYAAYPNYAAVTYPRQYSPTAWPYIGPFYPYPQVPLGWRKVTLEWDDGWWMLNFKD